MTKKPFEFAVRRGDNLSMEDAVYQAIGAASMCWERPEAAGIFESDRAKEIGDKLLARIRSYIVGGVSSGV